MLRMRGAAISCLQNNKDYSSIEKEEDRMRTMRAQVLTRVQHFELKEVPVPEINDDEVLIKINYDGT